jgi:hypothetical protein
MMTILPPDAASLSDDELLSRVTALARDERRATLALIAALVELDRRKLFLGLGYPSLFVYCTQVLHLSEHAAYNRIEAARAAGRFSAVLDQLADGAITLTTVCLLGPLLTADNHQSLLTAARHQSRRDIERLVAMLRPKPDVPASARKLPAPRSAERHGAADRGVDAQPVLSRAIERDRLPITEETPDDPRVAIRQAPRAAVTAPLGPDRYRIQFTASDATYQKLERARALLRHAIPDGDLASIVDRALSALLADIEKRKFAVTDNPRRARPAAIGSRHIPAAVRRQVWQRDGARCAFVGAAGRCAERGFLELHHVQPFATGGQATVENIQLRCRAHNAFESEQVFGPFMLRERPPAYARCSAD